jgi:hypothetical protein
MSGGWGIVAHLVRLRTNLVRSNPLLQTVFAANPPVSVILFRKHLPGFG